MLTYEQLIASSVRLCAKLPPDICAVVALPRKGFIPATVVAERFHIPLFTFDEFWSLKDPYHVIWEVCDDGGMGTGRRRPLYHQINGSVLVVDDSCSGDRTTLTSCLQVLRAHHPKMIFRSAVVWGKENDADFVGDVTDVNDMQEAEFLNFPVVEQFAVDLDGVICEEPPKAEVDGEETWWENHFRTVRPLFLPRFKPVRAIVTARLERYRQITEEWLRCWGVKYEQLIMNPAITVTGRGNVHGIVTYKQQQINKSGCTAFVESSRVQCNLLRRQWGKPIFCVEKGDWTPAGGWPTIFLVMPFCSNPNMLSTRAFWTETCNYANVVRVINQSSILTKNFNVLWAAALNLWERGEITHLVMLHSDAVPAPGFLNTLHEELYASGADLLSAVMAIKDMRGLSSTAISDPLTNWEPAARLTMTEIMQLPETFKIEDCGFPERVLLANTGCWIANLNSPVFHKTNQDGTLAAHFSVRDRIPRRNGIWTIDCESEDWFFSRKIFENGGKVAVTRKIPILHQGGSAWPNNVAWGSSQHDTEGSIAKLRALAEAYDGQKVVAPSGDDHDHRGALESAVS